MLSSTEQSSLNAACGTVAITESRYVASDLVSTLCETVLDYQQHTTTVVRAVKHFNDHRWDEVRTLDDLERSFGKYRNDQSGNTALAQYLWGYKLWTRAEQLRGLVAFVRSERISTLDDLRSWARMSTFADFSGRVKGLGPVVYQWLVMRLGVETAKPDTHVLRFVSSAIGRPVTEREAIDGLTGAPLPLASRQGNLIGAFGSTSDPYDHIRDRPRFRRKRCSSLEGV